MIAYKCRVHAGVMFFIKSEKLKKIYEDCIDIYSNYDKLKIHTWPNAIDEVVFGIAMPMNNMKTIEEKPELFGVYPRMIRLKTDLLKGSLSFETQWGAHTDRGTLLHFGTIHTFEPLYRFDSECCDYMNARKVTFIEKIKYEKKVRLYILKIQYCFSKFASLLIRAKNKLIRIVKKTINRNKE